MDQRFGRWGNCGVVASGTVLLVVMASAAPAAEKADADGAEIFRREWIPGDARSHGGDGLGPLYNETSCISCHNQGGAGGGGPAGKNVEILTAFENPFLQPGPIGPFTSAVDFFDPAATTPGGFSQAVPQTDAPGAAVPVPQDPEQLAREQRQRNLEALIQLHPGFRHTRSVVLHRYATYPSYEAWRLTLKGTPVGGAALEPGAPLGLIGIEGSTAEAAPPAAPVATQVVAPSTFAAPVQAFGSSGGSTIITDASGFIMQQPVPAVMSFGMADTGAPILQAEREVLKQLEGVPRRTSRFEISGFTITTSQRNPTALFGAGTIDRIPAEVIEAQAERRYADYPEISGRVSRLKDGRIGRFGWKGQTATLRDFTLTACAVEVGLHVPDHPQAGLPHDENYAPAGLDLTLDECHALVEYLAALPSPQPLEPPTEEHAEFVRGGEQLFERVGCAACHTPDLGEASRIYSDLLLHDMGDDLGDTGSYGVFVPNSSPDDVPREEIAGTDGQTEPREPIGATRLEWRTPPLWGVRDSAPYMHDGRADTLEQAIALHGGEAKRSAQMYFALLPRERLQVLTMLRGLVAPGDAR